MRIGLSQEPDALAVHGAVAHTEISKSLTAWTKIGDPSNSGITSLMPGPKLGGRSRLATPPPRAHSLLSTSTRVREDRGGNWAAQGCALPD